MRRAALETGEKNGEARNRKKLSAAGKKHVSNNDNMKELRREQCELLDILAEIIAYNFMKKDGSKTPEVANAKSKHLCSIRAI